MRRFRQTLMLAAMVLAAATPLFGLDNPTPKDLERNKQRLKLWRADPKNYDQLRRSLAEFLDLPKEKKQALRRLDRHIHKQSPARQAHLLNLMERYADWLERLPSQDRRDLREKVNWKERLERIRKLRERQWLERLPTSVRLQIVASWMVSPIATAAVYAHLRQKDRERHRQWKRAFDNWDTLTRPPLQLKGQKRPFLKTFITEYLRPRLSEAEKKRLSSDRTKPLVFGRTLVELADKHPLALPGENGPTQFKELPSEIRGRLAWLVKRQKYQQLHKRSQWPEFGRIVTRMARENEIVFPLEWCPWGFACLSKEVKEFVGKMRKQVLTRQENAQLDKAAKRGWPAYPETIERLAHQHRLQVPWLTLPGNRERWDAYRPKVVWPPLPRQTLRLFALLELTPQKRKELGLTYSDPATWERLKQEYFRQKPQELERLRKAELTKQKGKGKKGKKN